MEPPGRVSVDGHGDRTTITLRPGAMWWTALLALVCLAGVAAFLFFIPGRSLWEAFPRQSAWDYMGMEWSEVFMGLVAGYFAAVMGLRAVALRETIIVGPHDVWLRDGVLPLSRPERFRVDYMRRLRASPEAAVRDDANVADPWQYAAGRNVAFDYGLHTVRFGLRLDEDDAERVVAEIGRHLTVPDEPYTFAEAAALRARYRDGTPPPPRTQVEWTPPELRIIVPALRSRLLAVVYGLGFLAVIGMVCASLFWPLFASPSTPSHPSASPHPDGALLWHIGAIFALGRFALWKLCGREEITVDARDTMRIIRHFGLLQPAFSFDLHRVYALDVAIQPGAPGASALGLEGGNIRFAYPGDSKYHRFGIGLPEAEAQAIIRLLETRLEVAVV